MNGCQPPPTDPWTAAAIILTALGAVVFVISYAWTTRGNWRRNPLGWNVMLFMLAIAIVSSLAVAGVLWGTDWPHREIIRPVAWAMIGACIWQRVILLYRVQHQPEPTPVDPS